jgi:PAS domain S-box-containing protein
MPGTAHVPASVLNRFEEAGVGFCLVGPDGAVQRVNAEWLRATGSTAQQVVGGDILDLFPGVREAALALLARARAGHRVEVPRHAQIRDGHETWWEGSVEPVQMGGGTGLLITGREVLRPFQTFYETAPAAFLVLAPDRPRFTILAASEAYLRATKTSRDIIGRGIFEVFPDDPDDPASTGRPARASFERVLVTGAPDSMAVQKHSIRRPEAEGAGFDERYWSPINTPVVGEDGEVLYIHHRVEDVTEFVRQKQKGAEQQAIADMMRTRAGEMESDVLRRAQELQESNRQLRAANEKLAQLDRERERRAEEKVREGTALLRENEAALREADRQKNQFLAMLSHELRNPLAPIRNSLYILDRAAPGGEQAKRAQAIIHRQIGQLTWLIDDLLDVTRITHGKIQLKRERLDLNELAHRTAEDHRAVFSKSDVRLEVLPAPAEVWVNGDRMRLAQVVSNLLQNAAKFTSHGGKATVSVASNPARGQALLTVRDTGCGIEPEMLPRLFHAFTQADATLDRSKGGLGLGLALVKGLVELHGGSVSAASDGPGKGAVFTITLPLDVMAARIVPLGPGVGGTAAPRRVLVIEDNEDAADSLREVLELLEHVVDVAYTGRNGIEKARAFHPDVVLCDIGLPEMDGYEVARIVRADPELGRMGLVALSGYAQPEDVEMAREAGFDAHLAKPPSIDALARALVEVGKTRDDQPVAS